MDLTDSFVAKGKEIPSDPSEWPIVQRHISPNVEKGSKFMVVVNNLALLPGHPLINCLEEISSAAQHNGSRIIAVSRTPVSLEGNAGRYAILQIPEPPSVWATWIKEEDAQIIFRSLVSRKIQIDG